MNYRHIFHAGNICDVVKHAVLVTLIGHLRNKSAPFCVIDTHAGIGLYDLEDPRAQKTGEAAQGILRCLAAPVMPDLSAFYAVLQSFNPGWHPGSTDGFRFYPGSPFFAAKLLRPEDRLIVCELHPEDSEALKKQARIFPQMQIHLRDGYDALRAFCPPAEKRGLVLIDPPYESPDEFTRLAEGIIAAHRHWSQGMFMVWYPVKDRSAIWRFQEAMTASGIPRQLCAEFVYEAETRADRLNGCGILIINPPWKLDENLLRLFPALHEALQTAHHGIAVNWLTPD